MNIQEAGSILVGYFIKHDSLSNSQFKSIAPKKTSELEAEAGFTYALNELEKREIVSKFIGTDSEGKPAFIWVLKQPLIFNKQYVEVDGSTSIAISNVVNNFFQQAGDKENYCNPLQIQGQDLHILLEIIDLLASGNVEKKNEEKVVE